MPRTDALLVTAAAGDCTALELAADARLAQDGKPVAECRYRMLDTDVHIRYATAAQAARVHPALAHLEVEATTPDAVPFDVVETHAGHVVLDNLVPRGYARTLDALTPIVKHLVAQSALAHSRWLMEIHAGVVACGDACVLLPGPSGSGKSTLTLGLAEAGFAYLSDEIALLDEATLAVRPFPLAVGVKPGAVPLIERFRPDVADLDAHLRDDGKRVRYMTPARGRLMSDFALPARWLIFPRYDPVARTALQPISPSEALRRLLQECVSLPQLLDATRVERVVRWMRLLECYELPMSSLDEAVAEIKRVCGT